MAKKKSFYRAIETVLFRVPLLPIERYHQLASNEKADEEDSYDSILQCLDEPLVRLALVVGSRPLVDAIERAGDQPKPDVLKKLLRYFIRMSTRPTPYGLFAGVALASLGDRTDIMVAPEAPQWRSRLDMSWLIAFVEECESTQRMRELLRVCTNPAAYFRAGRVVLGERVLFDETEQAPEVSIRASRAIVRTLEFAQSPVRYIDLRAELLKSPGASYEVVDGFLTSLMQQTFLISDLRPPLTSGDPSEHVLSNSEDACKELRKLLNDLSRWDKQCATEQIASYKSLVASAGTVIANAPTDTPFQVDMKVPLERVAINETIGEEVVRAAELLLRFSSYPEGSPALRAYKTEFLSKYGLEREVPVLELLDPNLGLGAYSSFASHVPASPTISERHARLVELAACAQRDLDSVLDLNDVLLRQLAPDGLDADRLPFSLDLSVFVGADSPASLDAGEFEVHVGPNVGAMGAARTMNRFAHLLGHDATQMIQELAIAEDSYFPDTINAELVYLPQRSRSANVSVRPKVRKFEIPVGLCPGLTDATSIPLREIVIGVHNERFYARWPKAGKRLRVLSGHMLNPNQSPDVCRFLSDVTLDGTCQLTRFSWGPAESFPYLPRVQAGRVILRPAEWKITTSVREKLFPSCSAKSFPAELEEWRKAWRVPRYVYIAFADNRLLLDLDDKRQADELRSEIAKQPPGNPLVLQDIVHPVERTWSRGANNESYFAELIVSLARNANLSRAQGHSSQPQIAPDPISPSTSVFEPRREQNLVPLGGEWLFLSIYIGADIQNDVIARPLQSLVSELLTNALVTGWFFVRYTDPDHHIRIRLRCASHDVRSQLYEIVCGWADTLITDGFCRRCTLDTYDQEVERYGGQEGLALAEDVFCVDSVAVSALLALADTQKGAVDPLDVAVASTDALLRGLGLTEEDLIRWLKVRDIDRKLVGKEYRNRQRDLVTLVRDMESGTGLTGAYGTLGENIRSFRERLEPLGARLSDLNRSGKLSQPLDRLYSHYAHMHFNRIFGIDAEKERLTLGLLLRTIVTITRLDSDTVPEEPNA